MSGWTWRAPNEITGCGAAASTHSRAAVAQPVDWASMPEERGLVQAERAVAGGDPEGDLLRARSRRRRRAPRRRHLDGSLEARAWARRFLTSSMPHRSASGARRPPSSRRDRGPRARGSGRPGRNRRRPIRPRGSRGRAACGGPPSAEDRAAKGEASARRRRGPKRARLEVPERGLEAATRRWPAHCGSPPSSSGGGSPGGGDVQGRIGGECSGGLGRISRASSAARQAPPTARIPGPGGHRCEQRRAARLDRQPRRRTRRRRTTTKNTGTAERHDDDRAQDHALLARWPERASRSRWPPPACVDARARSRRLSKADRAASYGPPGAASRRSARSGRTGPARRRPSPARRRSP